MIGGAAAVILYTCDVCSGVQMNARIRFRFRYSCRRFRLTINKIMRAGACPVPD